MPVSWGLTSKMQIAENLVFSQIFFFFWQDIWNSIRERIYLYDALCMFACDFRKHHFFFAMSEYLIWCMKKKRMFSLLSLSIFRLVHVNRICICATTVCQSPCSPNLGSNEFNETLIPGLSRAPVVREPHTRRVIRVRVSSELYRLLNGKKKNNRPAARSAKIICINRTTIIQLKKFFLAKVLL